MSNYGECCFTDEQQLTRDNINFQSTFGYPSLNGGGGGRKTMQK